MKILVRCFCLTLMLAMALTSCKTDVDDTSPSAPPMYTITYVDADGKVISTQKVRQDEGEKGISPKAEKTGYKPTYTDKDGKAITGTYKVTGDTTITVKYTPITYTVKFDKGDGTGEPPANIAATYDKELTLPDNTLTAPAGYSVSGWKDGEDKTYDAGKTVKNLTTIDGATVTLTANFVSNTTYTTTFINSTEKAPANVTLPAALTLNKGNDSVSLTSGDYKLADQTGYTFDGWYDEEGSKVTTLSATDTTTYKDITLTAKWKPWTATISYDYDATENQTIEWGVKTNLATATQEEKTLVGWTKTYGAKTADFNPGQELIWNSTETISQNGRFYLYPVWKDLPVIVTITTSAPYANGVTDISLTYNKDASTFQATLDGATTFTWYIDNTEQENEVRDSMSIYKVPDGTHTVTVTAKKDYRTYSATMVVKTTTSTSI